MTMWMALCGILACVIVAFMDEERRTDIPRCSEADVDPEWWTEPDSFNAGKDPLVIDNSLRAKLYCNECPLLQSCRDSSWDEPAHVWGGMDTSERFYARLRGEVPTRGLTQTQRVRPIPPFALEIFLKGGRTEEVAASMRRSVEVTRISLRRELHRRRVEAEGRWGTRVTPPALENSSTLEAFRTGAELPSEFRAGPAPFESWNLGEAS